jgi:NAD(P)-dependent dehydrogenase (short-subunit alcohol dehydrogenase family)
MRLKEKVAIVTGGASGIGAGIVKGFLREGARVAIVDLNGKSAAQMAETLSAGAADEAPRAIGIAADVTSVAEVRRMAETVAEAFGGIDILVNNAGARIIKSFMDHTAEDWHRMIDINLTGPFYCSQAVVPHMARRGGGKIIHLASIASFLGRPGRVAYVAAKSGVLGLTKAMAADLSPLNIRVNAIAPGAISTPFNAMFAEDPESGPAWARENYIGRWGQPDDVAHAAIFLASSESDYMTGADIKVDGGWTAAKARSGEEVVG